MKKPGRSQLPKNKPTGKRRKVSGSVGPAKIPFEPIVEGYRRTLFLGQFAEAGRLPSIEDVDVAVCFADLRGFTKYVDAHQSSLQDSRVHQLLGGYFQLYPKAILEAVYALEPEKGKKITAQSEHVRNLIVPKMFKNLGDGMMLVWELQGDKQVRDAVSAQILSVVAKMQRLFKHLVESEAKGATKPYSTAVASLRLGFGLARGRAWRLDFGTQRMVDYAGTIVNIAARLQDLARPEGVVAEIGFCDPVLQKSTGQRLSVHLRGIVNPVSVWASNEVRFVP